MPVVTGNWWVSHLLSFGLSPLISALYLDALDRALGDYVRRIGGVYIRYVDDWILLCNKRWHLRKAVKKMNLVLEALCVSKAEKKTFIGKTDKGYDWLGYRIEVAGHVIGAGGGETGTAGQQRSSDTHTSQIHQGESAQSTQAKTRGNRNLVAWLKQSVRLVVNRTCIQNHIDKFNRLYERGASKEALVAYLKRWWVWARGGVVLDGELSMGRGAAGLV